MSGQGSPSRCQPSAIASFLGQLTGVALALCLLGGLASAQDSLGPPQDMELRLRVAWGGGAAKNWTGTITLAGGYLEQPKLLGLEADEPGSIYLDQGVLKIESRSARSYDGLDLTFRGPPSAQVTIDLSDKTGLDPGLQLRLPLAQFAQEVQSARLDDTGNRLVARRAPGDKLRVKFNRDHLVFDPGEVFPFQVIPRELGLPANASYTVRMTLAPARGTKELWSEQFSLTTDTTGNFAPLEPITLTTPAEEGVYDLAVSVHPWQFTSAIRRAKPVLQRKLQLVVMSKQAPPAATEQAWSGAAFEIDPANPSWWDRLPRWSLTNIWPSFSQGPISHGEAKTKVHLERTWIELPPEAWQAYPLGIGELGKPHMLEVEYPSDTPQRLGISIVEPNAGGNVAPQGVDSGVIVTDEETFVDGKVVRHRLLFWPKTESPLVLLTNRSDDTPAVFGKIRVRNGPARLAPMPEPNVGEAVVGSTPSIGASVNRNGQRLLTAYFDKPLFTDNFSATDALDSGSGRSLDDWLTFYQGGRRLVEYLKHMGYNGAIVSVSCEGSTLYPSKLLGSTPMYDNGVFFVSGQDPVQKDVVELLMRMFSREGLTLIPAMQFATPIPRLEAIRRQSDAQASGLEWIDYDGQPLLATRQTRQGLAPYYNPLNSTVGRTINEAVAEVSGRYRGHASYGGVALQLGPESYARLPGVRFGFDDNTIAAYQAATNQAVEVGPVDRFDKRARLLLGPQNQQWIRWRADRMALLYEMLGTTAAAGRADAKLYLADAHLQADPGMHKMLHPTLPRTASIENAMLAQGLDLDRLHKNKQLVVMRSRRDTPHESAVRNATSIEMNHADTIQRFYQQLGVTTSLRHSEPDILRLTSFDDASPWGPERTFTRLVSQMSRSEAGRREALIGALAESDKLSLSEGGWMLPLGQEDAVRDLFATWRELPAAAFETVPPNPMEGPTDGTLIVRRLQRGGQTYVYLINNAPWPVAVDLELAIGPTTPVRVLGNRNASPLEGRVAGRSGWKVMLGGYDLVAAVFAANEVPVASRRVDAAPRVREKLQEGMAETNRRINALQNAPPLKILANSSFEAPPLPNDLIPTWVYSRPAIRKGGTVTLDGNRPHTGGQCLKMENTNSVAWLRSSPITPPTTGRVAILVWIRADEDGVQPRVQLSLDYDFAGERRYESKIAGGAGAQPLRPGWTPYVANFEWLPAERVSDLRVGVDVMTPGVVWVDDVEIYDSRFEAAELAQLTKIWALANFALDQGRVGDCHQVMSGYWPRFLNQMIVPPKEVAALPEEAKLNVPAAPREVPPKEEESPGFFDRMKQYSPTKWRLPFG